MLIYATSNRRHLLPEYMQENLETQHDGDEVHPGEAVEEKISLSERFGLWIIVLPVQPGRVPGDRRRSGWRTFGVRARAMRSARGGAGVGAAARLAQRPRRLAVRARLRGRRTGSPGRSPMQDRSDVIGSRGRDPAARRRLPARAAAGRQGLRRLLGVPRRQARAGRDGGARAGARAARGARHRRRDARTRGSRACSSIPHAHVRLHFFRVCVGWRASGQDDQAFAWQRPGAAIVSPLLPANTRVLAALALPLVYAITMPRDGESRDSRKPSERSSAA